VERDRPAERRVLLTGASSGIGSELARRLARGGARLALAARRRDRLQELAAELEADGARAPVVLPADLERPGEAEALAGRALDALGRVDVLVNNAGGALHGLQWVAGDGDEARGLYEVNYWSPLALIRRLVPAMRERGAGTVVNVTSMVQVSPFPSLGHYCSSKAALALATQTLRMELRGSGVRVIEAPLGVVDSPGSYENRTLAGAERWLDGGPKGSVAGAAKAIAGAIDSGRARVIYPRWVGLGYALPGLARHFAARHARGADLGERPVQRTGSSGGAGQRAARERWEREHSAPR
jgi:short-subunit dehydrogenase